MPKILHIGSDEKFIDAANYLYEKAFPKSNTFVIILPRTKKYKIKYVSKKENYLFFNTSKKTLRKVLNLVDNYDLVVLHGCDFFKCLIVKKSPNTRFNYIIFGGEIYNRHPSLKNSILGEKTKQLTTKQKILKDIFRPLFHLIKYKVFDVYKFQFKIMKKVDYLSIIHKEDYDLFISKNIINPQTKYLKFTYYPIEFIFGNNKNVQINSNNILLGNSASNTNNHIEAIDIISKLNLNQRKVIVPLSYGDKNYTNVIINYGKKKLNNNFKSLTDFMSLAEYNKILQSCSIVIMNHYRQQAIGTILSCIWMGAKVFLNRQNTFYHYLKRIGCYVYLIEELNQTHIDTLLNNKQIEHNRKILIKEIGTDVIVKTLQKDLVEIIK